MVEYKLTTPISEGDVRKLHVGDIIYLTGLVLSARDQAHRRIIEYTEKRIEIPVNLDGAVIYHLGPLMKQVGKKWTAIAAGPTTSSRMNASTPKLLEKSRVRVIVGKGGMNIAVLEALKHHGAVYCHFTGGAAVLAARNIREVEGVEWPDLGMAEAMWKLRVENFGPLIVTMDSHSKSIYEDVKEQVEENVKKLREEISQKGSV
jgi:fumarate hydratase subunit beta